MLKKSLLLMLLMTLLAPWAAAQQALPYTYGFEDNNLATDGWTSTSGAISTVAAKTGTYGYRFSYSVSSDVFLMSPILTGGTYGVNVSFYYKAYSSSYLDHFYVGYTTDENVTDPSAFTYGAMVTSSTSWQLYEDALPAGTVRVAIKYDADNYDDGYYLYLDDFSFTVASSCSAPTNALATYTSGTTATITWNGDAASYNLDVNGAITNNVTSPYVLNVTPATTYTVKVQADCGSEQSSWVNAGTFTTECPTSFSIPYSYGFENEGNIDCWTIEADNDGLTGVHNNSWASANLGGSYARTGEGFFFFLYTDTPPHYLISPLLSGISNGLHVEFWYRQYTNGVETFQVGYSTTDDDPGSFTWDAEVTASTTYQRYSANYPAGTKYVAVKLTSDDQYYLFLDDFVFEESASCLEPTAVTVTNQTTSGATVNWTAGGTETEWDIFVTDDATITPDDATTPTVASTSTKPYTLTSLNPATTYYVYVRAICAKPSAWSSPATFNTLCEGMSLPYSYDFQDTELPICWSTINTYTSYNSVGNMAPSSSTNRVLYFYRGSSTGTLVAVLPEVSTSYPLNGYQITFDACYANGSGGSMTAGKLGIGIMTDPSDFTTFELIEEIDITDGFSTYGSHNVMFNTYTGSGRYIAIQDIHTQSGYVLVDNIAVTELPACLPPTGVTVNGGFQAVVSWTGTADSFDIAFSDDPTVDPKTVIVGNSTTNSFNLYEAVTLTEGDYTVWVRGNCGGSYSAWASTTLSLSYCTPNPTSHDGSGITAVSFGTGSYVVNNGDGTASIPASAPFYGNYSSMIGAVHAGVESTIAITTSTGSYPYTFVIWVDLDNDFTFEDTEVLYIGKATSGNGTLNATITVPATQTLGDYRMRIYGADSYFTNFYNNGTTNWSAAHDPCSSGTYRHAHDYTLRVLEAPNCLAPSDLDANNITAHTAELSWTANSGETSWNIYYKKASDTDYTEVANVKENPYTLSGLNAGTDYVYYVEAKCSGTETSDPSSTFNFTTECDAFTITATDKYTQDFESPVVTSTYSSTTDLHIPSCWENPYTTGSSAAGQPHLVKAGASYNYSTGQVLLFYGSGYNYVTLPEFTNALNELQITFKWATESSSYGTLTLGYITDGDVNYNTFTEIAGASYPASSSSYHTMLQADPVYLNTLPATAKRLVFRWYYSGQYSCNVDDVEVSLMPSCYPIGTLTYDNLASQTVDLHWTLVDATQDAWQVCLNNDETNLIDITTTDVTISGNAVTYSLSGLTAETAYTVKVRANCGGSDFSDWSNTVSFTTLAACATPTGLAASNLTQNGANLAWTGSSDVAAYTVQYRTAAGLQTHYFEGFEDGLGDWTKVDCASSTGISTGSSYAHTGNAAFKFSYNTNPPQYLVSPAISGITSGMQLEFWYKNGSTSYSETFQVGFSSTDNDVASFAFEDEITASDAQWHSYSVAVPATTKYLCFKLNSNDQLSLYIDDITIGAMVAAGTWQTAANDVTTWNYELAGLTASVKYDARVYANCTSDPETENSMTTFTTLADGTMVFTNASGDGMWSTADNWTPGIPTISDNAVLRANATITGAATANKITFEGTTTPTLTINDGGTLQTNTNVTATVKKHITGYTAAHHDEAVGYYLIANPLNSTVYYSNFATVGLTSGSYDIYSWSYSGEDGKEWRNFRASNFSLATQTGYLYANESDVDFTFTGTVAANNADVTKSLNYATSGTYAFNGWNLVGNPFACNAYTKDATSTDIAFYRMNNAGSGFEAATGAIKPMEGIFVKATATGQSFRFTREQPITGYGNGNLNISLANVVTSRDAVATTDKAIVRFDGGGTLEKFMFREDNMKIYIPQDGTDFAVVASEAKGMLPVNVKVTTTGEYTISISNEDVDFTYLHLIDRLTGEDVDLLIEDSYTFYASPRDQENRFTLVFNSIDGNIDATSEIFAYQNGNQIIVSGEGTLQVYDVMGRYVATYNINGTESINASQFENAVYIFRLVGTDVKTQKIVIR